MSITEKPLTPGDRAYRVLILHTQMCATCRANRACVTAVKLNRKWRAAK